MNSRKRDIPLPARTPAYVSREGGAAELSISVSTWDDLVKAGVLPKPVMLGTTGKIPRWRWSDVDAAISGDDAGLEGKQLEPFLNLEGLSNGKAKGYRRAAS